MTYDIQRMSDCTSDSVYRGACDHECCTWPDRVQEARLRGWSVPRTLDTHIVPKVNAAADEAGLPSPRVCVGLPVCVSDDRQPAFEAASGYYGGYGNLPSYRSMLDIEGVESPAEVAIIGE